MRIKNILSMSILFLFLSSHSWAVETRGVVTSIKPLHSLVSGVMGDTGKAKLLLTGTASPHGYALKPSQIKAIQEAQIIFYFDYTLEAFLRRALENAPGHVKKAGIIQEGGLKLYPHREGGAWEADKHDHGGGHDDHDDHADHDDHRDHLDPHVWLDPENARRIVKFITRELSALYPENRDIYKANARAIIKKINTLDATLRIELIDVKKKPFIVFHDAYQYFERAYDLNGVGSITFEPEEMLSPKRLGEVRKKLRQTGAKCVFREPQFSDRVIKTVKEGSNTRIATLDPLGANLRNDDRLYFKLMTNLARNLKRCLK